VDFSTCKLLQLKDSNLRPSGYEPDELASALSCDLKDNEA
jgi:hypothetical protein